MESNDVSRQLRELLGDAVCEILTGGCEATLHFVVYDPTQATGRIEPFSVAGKRALSAAECLALRESLLDEATWQWDFITRHLPVPEVLFELFRGDQRAVFLLDRRGGKLGFIRDLKIYARDLDANSHGARILSQLVDAPGSAAGKEGR